MNNRLLAFHLFFCLMAYQPKAQNWAPVGGGMSNFVQKLYTDSVSNKLYATGAFMYAGGKYVRGAAVWDGSEWDTVFCHSYAERKSFFRYGNKLYFSGQTTHSWDGVKIDTLVISPFGFDCQFMEYESNLLASGFIDSINHQYVGGLGKFDGSNWSQFDTVVFSQAVVAGATFSGELYVGGNFIANGGSIDRLARWKNNQWQPVGNGIVGGFGSVSSFEVYNDELYIGGSFNTSNCNPGNCVARWDGSQWLNAGIGMTSQNALVYDLQVFNGDLYACGQFYDIGGLPITGIAKWDGVQWCSLMKDIMPNSKIYTMAVFNNELYIGGRFLTIDGDTLNYIAKWIGGNFSDMCTEPIGITEADTNSLATLHPNPATTHITITGVAPNTTATITNLHGQVVLQSEIRNPQPEISVEALPPGLYFCILQSGYERKVLRFVKQ